MLRRGLAALGLCLVATVLMAEVLNSVPLAVKPLLDARKFDEASLQLYTLIDAEKGEGRLPLLKLVFEIDPDVNRLDSALERWLPASENPVEHHWLSRNLGQLRLLKRDFKGALTAFDLGGAIGDLQLRAGQICLLLGDFEGAQLRLNAVIAAKDSSLISAASAGLAWKLWAEGKPKSAYDLVRPLDDPAGLTLQCLLGRTLGLKKEEQASREKLSSLFPHSVYVSLVDGDSDPSTQIDMTLLVLLGIGPAVSGSDNAQTPSSPTPKRPVASTAPDENQVAKGIQVGLFKSAANAKKLADNLKAKGFRSQVEQEKNASRWKVMVTIPRGQDPQTVLVQLKDIGIEGFLSF